MKEPYTTLAVIIKELATQTPPRFWLGLAGALIAARLPEVLTALRAWW